MAYLAVATAPSSVFCVISSGLAGSGMLKASARFLASWAVGVHLTEAEGAGIDVGVAETVPRAPARLTLALATAPPPGKACPAWASLPP